MRCCAKRLNVIPIAVLLLSLLSPVWAAGSFSVLSANTRLDRGIYLLDANLSYQLSPAVTEALQSSVPLTIQLDMEVRRDRSLMWDEVLASLQQRFRLTYHALARQYVVTNLNSDQLHSFPTQDAAFKYMGRIRDFPLLDRSLLKSSQRYVVALKVELDIESLPAPLRPHAYLSSDWRLASRWYQWQL